MERPEYSLFTENPQADLMTFQAIRFTLDQLLENLHRQIDDVFCRYGQRAHAVLLGTDEARQLFCMHHLAPNYFTFQVPFDPDAMGKPIYHRVMGLNIHHLPWMVGLLVVPQLMEYVSVPNTVNQWSLTTGQHQLVGTGAQKVNVDRGLPEEQIRMMLANFKRAFVSWAEKPADKPFLREPTWWNRLWHGTKG